ncbi:unnamed protein product [Allacma fusca]|uniref:G-protein coupled receptors family 1 profile domain-containing protein n=1 Tax=Allacma fusca TaxID=39272 RepID=A0A8J2PD21_9HEXA|nr:unnamed protein product [Allacma fusca]
MEFQGDSKYRNLVHNTRGCPSIFRVSTQCLHACWNVGFLNGVTNYFLVNLSVADLLVTLLCMPMAVGKAVTSLWLYGEIMCKLTHYLQVNQASRGKNVRKPELHKITGAGIKLQSQSALSLAYTLDCVDWWELF